MRKADKYAIYLFKNHVVTVAGRLAQVVELLPDVGDFFIP